MGLLDSLRGQFVDVIERVDDEGTTLVTKYERPGDEIKQGSQVIVREGQCAVFMKGGALADIMDPSFIISRFRKGTTWKNAAHAVRL